MIGIVRVALHRPLTFIVMAILIAIMGVVAAIRTPVDMFPNIGIPVIGVAWTYAGLPPEDMANRIVTQHERTLGTNVNDIEHIESQSLQNIGIIKIFLQPDADLRTATAQVTSISQTALRGMPPGTQAPIIVNYSASTVPVLQLAMMGKGMSEQQMFDIGQNQIRQQLITVHGVAMPFPSGGKQRQVQVDLDPLALQSKGLSAQDVGNAIAAQNQINPAGFVKIGPTQYSVRLNNTPATIEGLNDLPIKVVNGATIYMRDVAHVRDGSPPQTNVVLVEGRRSTLLTILKNGATSTLSVIGGVKEMLGKMRATFPPNLKVLPVNDQSLFVRAAVKGVIYEGSIAAALTSLMILLFLGSWRSTVIIAMSIPLAVLAAIAALSAFGQTLNVMTLGGLALAVGILVDDATVTIENINWHLEQGKSVLQAILDGAAQIVTPAFVSLLCICIVFVPMFFLPGVAGYLFVPMALSVVFAMIASFILSRTLVPTMAMYLLRRHGDEQDADIDVDRAPNWRDRLIGFQRGFELRFERIRTGYGGLLRRALGARKPFMLGFLGVVLISFLLLPFLGSNFFPSVDAGQIVLHSRAPVGARTEDTTRRAVLINQAIRQLIPADELMSITNNIGLPLSALNTIYATNGGIGPQDADTFIALKEHHRATPKIVAELRRELPRRFPGTSFYFLPADITSQILNFGSPAPIDVQISGPKLTANRDYAEKLLAKMATIPGIADARIQQPASAPQLDVNVDRARAGQYGLTERDVTASLSNMLAGSSQAQPVFYVNPDNGVSYSVVAQTPEYMVQSINDLSNVPVSGGGPTQMLGGLAEIKRSGMMPVVSQYDIRPVIDIYASTQGRDLGAVAGDVKAKIKSLEKQLPKGVTVTIRGQYATMNTAFSGLALGLIGAILMIYLLIVVNFQSWTDPLVIISALPAALAGIVWILFTTGTTLSVPALTGAIMCMGVATANSILVVSFAREQLALHGDAVEAALRAGMVRFRPVVMTALAMIIGMTPMALGLGDGGEQNAPLGLAVIGGLLCATVATLFFVPTVFSFAHRHYRPVETPLELQPSHA
jgi:CzcA family heavy metal efflux pump